MSARSDILFPGFEREMLRMGDVDEHDPALHKQLDEGLRLAVLFSRDAALVPAPGFFETSCGYTLVRHFAPSVERGQLVLLGSGGHPGDYTTRKLLHWADDFGQLDLYGAIAEARIATLKGSGWRPKRVSTDSVLVQRWTHEVAEGEHPLLGVWRRSGAGLARAQRALDDLPEKLEGAAIVVDNLARLLPPKVAQLMRTSDLHDLRLFLAHGFFRSYLDDAEAMPLVDGRSAAAAAVRSVGVENVDLRRLLIALDGLGLRKLLLTELNHAQLAELSDSARWQSLRPDLLRRATQSSPFSARDLMQLRRVPELQGTSGTRSLPALELHLERLAVALAKASRGFVPGDSRRPGAGQMDLWNQQTGAQSMGGTHFNGPTTIYGAVNNLEKGGRVEVTSAPVSQVLTTTLPQVLGASSPTDAEAAMERLESALRGRELTVEGVAEVVQRDLAAEVENTTPSVRQTLINLGTGAGAGVIAQGVMLGIKALIGG